MNKRARFNQAKFEFGGWEYTVPGNEIFGLVEAVEEVITMFELTSGKLPPATTLAKAYANALNYAGAEDVTAEDVYVNAFKDADFSLASAVYGILALMNPPDEVTDPGKKKSRKKISPKKTKGEK